MPPAAVIFLSVILLLCLLPEAASACDCNFRTLEEAYKEAEIVALGEVQETAVWKASPPYFNGVKWKVRIDRQWKGPSSESLVIGSKVSSCQRFLSGRKDIYNLLILYKAYPDKIYPGQIHTVIECDYFIDYRTSGRPFPVAGRKDDPEFRKVLEHLDTLAKHDPRR